MKGTLAALLAAALLAPPATSPEEPRLTPLESSALARAEERIPQRTRPVLSEPLVLAARELAAAAARGDPRPLSSRALRAALDRAGVVDPAPAALVLSAPPASLADSVAAAVGFRGATHVGIGVVLRDGVAWAVLLATERRAELEPVPRRVEPGSTLTVRGRLLRLSSPRVHVASPTGAVREIPVHAVRAREGAAEPGERFEATFTLAEPGTHRVEVGGTGPRGPTVAAILDVVAGPGSPPASDGAGQDLAEPRDVAAAEETVHAAVNALRADHGLPPLRRLRVLDAAARRHSEAMLAAGTVAHRVGDEDVVARLLDAGVPYRSARENVARGDGALDAHRAVADSPAHRANLLAVEVSVIGVGIARGRLPGGQPVTYLTEILVEPRGPLPAGTEAPAGAATGSGER